LAALLREAAHELGEVRETSTTSRGGHYHNRKFAELAEELGLEVTESSRLVGDHRAGDHEAGLRGAAGAAGRRAGRPPEAADERPQRGGRKVALYCRCPRGRVPCGRRRARQPRGGIRCEVCGEPFTARS
jgi:hypothetical protein